MSAARTESQCMRRSSEYRRSQDFERVTVNMSISTFQPLLPAPSISTSPSRLSPARRALAAAATVAKRRSEFEALAAGQASPCDPGPSICASPPRSPLSPLSSNILNRLPRCATDSSGPAVSGDQDRATPFTLDEFGIIQIPHSYDITQPESKLLGSRKRAVRVLRSSLSVPTLEFKESLDNVLCRVKSAFLSRRVDLQGSGSGESSSTEKVRVTQSLRVRCKGLS